MPVTFRTAVGALGASVTAWSCSWGTASGRDGGDQLRPVPGLPCAAARRAVGLPPGGRGESCRPATAGPRRPLPLITGPLAALLSPGCSRQLALPVPAVGVARRRCALEAVEKVVTAFERGICPAAGPKLGRNDVLQDQRVTRHDGDHHADWLSGGGIAGPDVLRDRRSGRYPEPRYLIRRGHAGNDLVDVVDLLVASFGQDVLALGVLGLGQLGPIRKPTYGASSSRLYRKPRRNWLAHCSPVPVAATARCWIRQTSQAETTRVPRSCGLANAASLTRPGPLFWAVDPPTSPTGGKVLSLSWARRQSRTAGCFRISDQGTPFHASYRH